MLMPHVQGERLYTFREYDEVAFHGLPPILGDSLPDAFGNALIDSQLAAEGLLPSQISTLDRLAYVGSRAMGALSFEPDFRAQNKLPSPLHLAELVEAARLAVAGDLSTASARREVIQQLLAVGTSAAGAQAKAVVAWNPKTDELRAGNMAVSAGFEQWLLKFDGMGLSGESADGTSGSVEYAYHLMAMEAGIDVPAARLLTESTRAHFMVRRFDREADGEKLHLQTLAALAGLDFTKLQAHSYASLFLVADTLGLGGVARQELFRRLVFNVLAGNRDDHPKNFSFLMDRAGRWQLAPAYDLTFSWVPAIPWLSRHHLAVEGKYDHIARKDLAVAADRFAVPDFAVELERVEQAVAHWPLHAKIAGVEAGRANRISDALARLNANE
jgi:serine/threonine-protein kinase HipA